MAPSQASSPWSWFGWFGRGQPAAQPSQGAAPPDRPVTHAHLTEASDDDSVSSQDGHSARTPFHTGDRAGDEGSASHLHATTPSKAAGGRNMLTSWAPAMNPAHKKAEVVWLDDESYPPLPPPTSEPLPYDPNLVLTPSHAPSKVQSPFGSGRKGTHMSAVSGSGKDGDDMLKRGLQTAPQQPPPSLSVSEASFAFPGGPGASGVSASTPKPLSTTHSPISTHPAGAHAAPSPRSVERARGVSTLSSPAARAPTLTPVPAPAPPSLATTRPATAPTNAADDPASAVTTGTHHPSNAATSVPGTPPAPPTKPPLADQPSTANGALLFAAASFATASANTQGKWGSPKLAWNAGYGGGSPASQAAPLHNSSPPPTEASGSSGNGQLHAPQQALNTQHSPHGSDRMSARQQGAYTRDSGALQRPSTSSGALMVGSGGGSASAVSLNGGLVGPDAAKVDLRGVSGREAWASHGLRPHSSSSGAQRDSKRQGRGSQRGSRSSSSRSSSSSTGKGPVAQANGGPAEQVQGANGDHPMRSTGSSSGVVQVGQAAGPGDAARASSTNGSAAGAPVGSKDGSTANYSSMPGSGSYMSSVAGSWKERRGSSDDASGLASRRAAFRTKHRTSRLSDPGTQVYPSTPLLGSGHMPSVRSALHQSRTAQNSFTGNVPASDRDRGRVVNSAASSAAEQPGLLLPEGSGSYGAGVLEVVGAGGRGGTREVQPSSSSSLDRGKGGGWSLNAQDSSLGKHSDETQRSSATKRSVKFCDSSEDGSPFNVLPGATGFAAAQGNGPASVKPSVMEDAAAQSEPPGRALQPPSRVLPSFPSRLARVTQRLMPMFKGDSGEDQGEQMKGKEGGGLGEMDPENSSINHNGMPQRTGSMLFGGILGVLHSRPTAMQTAKPTSWAHRAKLLMKSQNGDLSQHPSENDSVGEDTSPSESKGSNSRNSRSHANRILRRVATSLGKSFTSSRKSRAKSGLDSDDSGSEGGDSPKRGNSRPQVLPYTSFDDAANRALLSSARKGDLNGVKEALDRNADPNLEDFLVTPEATNMGMTPLHYVAACGRQYSWEPPTCSDNVAASITRLLLQHGARKHPKDRMGFLPLHLAAYHGSMGVLKQLLEGVEAKSDILGCSINCQDYQVRYTPLHCAVEGRQPEAVVALLLKGASCTIKDYTSFTPWNLAATHMSSFAFSLITQLNIALAQDSRLPADAVMRLALEMRYLEAVPVVLRATAKCPQQVWALMRTAIASGLQEFAELLAEDIPTVCPRALLQVPWGDVMVELATRFPECFKILIHGLDYVDFESIVLPFIQGLNFDADPATHEVLGAPALPPSEPQKSTPSSRPNIAKLLSNKSARGSKLNRVRPGTDSPTISPSMNLYAVGGGLDSLRSNNNMDRSFTHLEPQLKVGCGKHLWSTLTCRADEEDLDDGVEEPDPVEDKKGIMSVLTRSSKATSSVPDKLPSAKATSLWQRASAAASTAASEQKPRLGVHGRAKSALSLKSMLVLGNQDEFRNGSANGPSARGPLPEALKYLLLRCLVSSLDKLSWKVWQALVGGLHGGLALEIAHFPKLFKRLAESIAERTVPDWREVAESDRMRQLQREENGHASSDSLSEHRLNDDFSVKYEQHMTLNLNHLVSAAIASRSGLNVYNIVMAMDRWLALNPTCYLGRLDPWVIGAMAAHYPDACRLLLSMEFQDQCAIKVPGHLVGSSAAPVFRCSLISQAFVWQEDGLVVLAQAGLDLKRVERWVIHGISFYAILKLFKASAYRYPSAITASFLEKLLAAGLPGQDITKLIQLDTDLNDVVAALKGGLSAHFIHHMVSRRISFQVVTEMLGSTLDKTTEWMNVRHQPVWKKFPRETWRYGITYTFIRIFFETWEDYRFDKRFIDLMFDFHDPLFVKLRTALEYVNSNKALQVSLSQEEADISLARRTRLFGSVAVVCQAFREQRIYVHRIVIAWMATLVTYMYLWAVEDFKPTIKAAQQAHLQGNEPKKKEGAIQKLTDASELDTPFDNREASGNMLGNSGLTESPKVDAISETLPMIDVAKTGRECYLRALLAADAPASMFGLPVVKGIINVKWISYGWRYMALLLAEHLVFMALVITYLVLIINENQVCADDYEGDGSTLRARGDAAADFAIGPASENDAEAEFHPGTVVSLQQLASCSTGIATLVLDALMSWMCALGGMSYVSQLRRCGFVLWILQADNWSDILTITLNAAMLGCHLGRKHVGLLSLVSVQVLLQFMRLGSYAMMIERLGSLVRIIGQIFRDTLYFLFLLLMLYVGFALAFFVLAPPSTPPGSLALKLFTIMLGDINASFFEDEVLEEFATPWLSVLLMIAYTIMLLIVLFNMLVAIMNDTFNRIRTAEHDEVLRGKAVQLVGIEASLSSEQLENLSRLLLGKFLHVLRPTRLDKDGSGNGGAGGVGKGASDTAVAVRDAVRDETAAIREEVHQMLVAFGQQSQKQPKPWGSHTSPPANTASRMGTRAHSRAVSKAPSRAVSRPTSAFPRHGAHLHPKPAIKQPHFSSQSMGSAKGSKASGPFLAPGDSAYPSRAPSEMVSRAASIPASRISSARTSLDGAGNSLPTGGARSLTAPLDSQGPQSWSERHSPPLATHNSGMSAQASLRSPSRSMGASVSLRDRHLALLTRPKSSFRETSSFREPPSVMKAMAAFSGAGAGSRHSRPPPATGSFTNPFEAAATAADDAKKAAFPVTAATRASQARHAAQIPMSMAQQPPPHIPPSQPSPPDAAQNAAHATRQRRGSTSERFEPCLSIAKEGDGRVQHGSGSSLQSSPDMGRAPSHEAGRSSTEAGQGATVAATEAENSSDRVDQDTAERVQQREGDETVCEAAAVAQHLRPEQVPTASDIAGAGQPPAASDDHASVEQPPAASDHAGAAQPPAASDDHAMIEHPPAASDRAESRPNSGEARAPSTQAQILPTLGSKPELVPEPAGAGTDVRAVEAEGDDRSSDTGAGAPASAAEHTPQKGNNEATTAPPAPARPPARGPAVRFKSMDKQRSSSEDSKDDGSEGEGEAAPYPQRQPQQAHLRAKRVSLGVAVDTGRGTGINFQPSRVASRAASRQPSRPASATRFGGSAHGGGGGATRDRKISDAGSWRAGSLNSSHHWSKEQEAVIPLRERASPPGGLGVHFSGELHANACFGDDGDETEDGGDDRRLGSGVAMQGNALYQENAEDYAIGILTEDDEEVEIDEDYGESEEEDEARGQDHSSASSPSGSSSSSSSLVEDDRHTLASHSILASRMHSVTNQAGGYNHRHPVPHFHANPTARRPFSSAASTARAHHHKGYSYTHQRHNPHDHPFPKLFSRAPSPPSGTAGSHGSGRSLAAVHNRSPGYQAKDSNSQAGMLHSSRGQSNSEAAASAVAAAMARVNERRKLAMAAGPGLLTPAEALKEAHGDPDSDEASFLDDLDIGHRAPAPAGARSRRPTFSQGSASRRQTASHGFGGHTPRMQRRRSTHTDAAAKLTVQGGSDFEAEGDGAAVEQPPTYHPSFQASRRMRPSGGASVFGSHTGEANPVGLSRSPSNNYMRGTPEAVPHQPVSLVARRSSSGAPHRLNMHNRVSHTGRRGSQSLLGAVRTVEEEGGGSDADSLAGSDADLPVPPKLAKLASLRESMGSFRDREQGLPVLAEEPQLVRSSSRRAHKAGIPDNLRMTGSVLAANEREGDELLGRARRATLDEERESRRGSGRSGASFEGLHESEEEEEDAAAAKRRRGRSRSRGRKVDAEIRAAAEEVVEKAMALSEAALSRGPGGPSVLLQQQQQQPSTAMTAMPTVFARPQRGPDSRVLQQLQQQMKPDRGLGHFPTFNSHANTPGNLSAFSTSGTNPTLPPGIFDVAAPAAEPPIDVFQEEPRQATSSSLNVSGNLPTNPFNSLRSSLSPARVPGRSSRNSRDSRNSRPSAMVVTGTVSEEDAVGGFPADQESGDDAAALPLSFESNPSSRALRAIAAATPQVGRLAYSRKHALQTPTLLTAPVLEDAAMHEGGHEIGASDNGSQEE